MASERERYAKGRRYIERGPRLAPSDLVVVTESGSGFEAVSISIQVKSPLPLPWSRDSGDLEREKLREANGFHELVQKTIDCLTLKPVGPKTERLYDYILHEWDLYISPRNLTQHGQESALTTSSFVLDRAKRDPGSTPSPMDAKTAKDFLLFYKTGRKGRIGSGAAVTDSSAETIWKCFMSAWQRKTGQHFPKPLRDTILNVRKTSPFVLCSRPPTLMHTTVNSGRGR